MGQIHTSRRFAIRKTSVAQDDKSKAEQRQKDEACFEIHKELQLKITQQTLPPIIFVKIN